MQTLDQAGFALEITLGVFVLVIAALIIAVIWFLVWLHWQACRGLRPPEVARDGHGRPLRERL